MKFEQGMMFENKAGTVIEILEVDGCYLHLVDNIDTDREQFVSIPRFENHLKEFGFWLAK